jgi:hypothetical protein
MHIDQNIGCQWLLFDFDTRRVTEMEVFRPGQYFMEQYLSSFDSYWRILTPWAPDSQSFVYATIDGLKHTQLVPGEGLGRQWIMPDVELGFWSWN